MRLSTFWARISDHYVPARAKEKGAIITSDRDSRRRSRALMAATLQSSRHEQPSSQEYQAPISQRLVRSHRKAGLRHGLRTGHDRHGEDQQEDGNIDLSSRLSRNTPPFTAGKAENLSAKNQRSLHKPPAYGCSEGP